MAATRLLVIADSRLLAAIANGLGEGASLDVHTAALSDPAAAQAATASADAVVVFYGAPGAPLTTALRMLSPKVRERGGQVVAVLQRDQAMQRDDCFRAGASDVFFMPMPKEQFVARLQASLELSFAADGAATAKVSIATRKSASQVPDARVCANGVTAAAELPLTPGETVRLQWAKFQSWGQVIRGAPSAQIRFAGLAPEEEAAIVSWTASSAQGVAAPVPAAPAAQEVPAVAAPVRAAPAAGPPPGFADRKPVRPQTRAPARAAAVAPVVPPAAIPPVAEAVAAAAEAVAAEPAQPATPWPLPVSAEDCRAVALEVLGGEPASTDAPSIAASARRIAGIAGSSEREAIKSAGPDSPLATALYARIALDVATREGERLSVEGALAAVDPEGVSALVARADQAAALLQKEANGAISGGEVEALQTITAASAALNRDLLAFRGMSDRLQGLAAAPRLGAGALDPEVVLPGHAPRPRQHASAEPAPVRPELRDFEGLDEKRGPGRSVALVLLFAVLAGCLAYAVYFSVPHHRQVSTGAAGPGVERIDVADASAQVTVEPAWLDSSDSHIPALMTVLRENGVKRAILVLPNGSPAGIMDVSTGKVSGLSPRQQR